MESQEKESRKLRIDKSFEMIEWLTRHCLTFVEAAIVVHKIEEGDSLAEAILYVYQIRAENGAKDEKLTHSDFNNPIAY